MNRIYKKYLNHFEGNRSMTNLALGLLTLGIMIFIANNTILFFVNEKEYFWPRLCMKALTDICWVTAAMLGARYYHTKRNVLLIPTLIFYTLGDIAVFFSVPVGGLLYGIGHVFIILAILETTYIHRWQRVIHVFLILIPVSVMLAYYTDPVYIAAGMGYGLIIATVLAFSLSNRFFWLAGLVFAASDLAGIIRLSVLDNKVTYVITTTIYFVAFFMLCISVYSTNRKEVVTWNDLFRLLKDSKLKGVSFWVCGKWAIGLIRGNRRYSYDHLDMAYDIDNVEEFMMWLRHCKYERQAEGRNGIRHYYSERYGNLSIYPCDIAPGGTSVLVSETGARLEIDEGFFGTVTVMGQDIPCIAPGGTQLIKDVIGVEEARNGMPAGRKERRKNGRS